LYRIFFQHRRSTDALVPKKLEQTSAGRRRSGHGQHIHSQVGKIMNRIRAAAGPHSSLAMLKIAPELGRAHSRALSVDKFSGNPDPRAPYGDLGKDATIFRSRSASSENVSSSNLKLCHPEQAFFAQ